AGRPQWPCGPVGGRRALAPPDARRPGAERGGHPVTPTDTVAACLTPPGQSALCSIAVCGPAAWEAVRALFRPRSGKALPAAPPQGIFRLGLLGETLADEVVVAVKGATQVEVTAHGGREVVRLLLEQLALRGVRVVRWQEL